MRRKEPELIVMLTEVLQAGSLEELGPFDLRILVECRALIQEPDRGYARDVGLMVPDLVGSKLAVALLANMTPVWRNRTVRLIHRFGLGPKVTDVRPSSRTPPESDGTAEPPAATDA